MKQGEALRRIPFEQAVSRCCLEPCALQWYLDHPFLGHPVLGFFFVPGRTQARKHESIAMTIKIRVLEVTRNESGGTTIHKYGIVPGPDAEN